MKVAIFGGGKIGATIARMLATYSAGIHYQVTLGEVDPKRVAELETALKPPVNVVLLDPDVKSKANQKFFEGQDLLVNAGPHHCNLDLIDAAFGYNLHYIDLTEDVKSADYARTTASQSGIKKAFIPQCGLAPGYISIVANHLAKEFHKVDEMNLRVGALPRNPDNRLKYNVTWSVDGLVNEYLRKGRAIRDGQLVETEPLGEYERLQINGVDYEAFNTSGGLGNLGNIWQPRRLDYKTLRYPGHLDYIKFLLEDLQLSQAEMVTLLDKLPRTYQDVIVTQVMVKGWLASGEFVRSVHTKLIFSDAQYTGIQKTTAGGACAIIEMLRLGCFKPGFNYVEETDFSKFVATDFYKQYYS